MRAGQRRRRIAMSEERLPSRHNRFTDRRGLDAWYTLLTFFNLVRTAVSSVLEPLKLSNDEFLVLICLAHSDDALSMGAIERSTFLPPGRVRRAVDKLEERRLLTWRRSRADRRTVLVRMKKSGLQLIEGFAPIMFELVARVAMPLGEGGTEFLRAKMRKIMSTARAPGHTHGVDLTRLMPQTAVCETGVHAAQRPVTWGLAAWLRWCQLSSLVDKLWRIEFTSLGITQEQLQVLAALSGDRAGLTVDAVVSDTGLPQSSVISILSPLERAGLVITRGDKSRTGNRLVGQTPKGAYAVLEALPMANYLVEDLYQGLGDEDLEQVLTLVRKACGAAWQVKQHYTAAQPLTSAASAQ
jgi:DNA-binding MarR family transcriptional regulator